jgi:AAA family ATP:ADP antiporter
MFSFYAILFLGISYFVGHPDIGLANSVLSKWRILGWVIYLSIESFGSLAVALFWSFVASSNDTISAKKGYALIICGAQFGSVAGPLLARMASVIGIPILLVFVVCGIMAVPFLVSYFVKSYPNNAIENVSSKPLESTGSMEGLRLLFSKPYLLGIFGLISLYEIIGTILDYQMKFMADGACSSVESLTELLAAYGFYANLLALIISLIGTSFLIKRFGLIVALVLFPVLVGVLILLVWINPSLYAFFVAMVMLKGFSYALNKPCVEIMYIPTSRDIKFKSKSWIDAFGSRLAKASGAAINAIFIDMATLLFFGSIISLGFVGLWIVIALYIGRTNQKLVRDNKIIS